MDFICIKKERVHFIKGLGKVIIRQSKRHLFLVAITVYIACRFLSSVLSYSRVLYCFFPQCFLHKMYPRLLISGLLSFPFVLTAITVAFFHPDSPKEWRQQIESEHDDSAIRWKVLYPYFIQQATFSRPASNILVLISVKSRVLLLVPEHFCVAFCNLGGVFMLIQTLRTFGQQYLPRRSILLSMPISLLGTWLFRTLENAVFLAANLNLLSREAVLTLQ